MEFEEGPTVVSEPVNLEEVGARSSEGRVITPERPQATTRKGQDDGELGDDQRRKRMKATEEIDPAIIHSSFLYPSIESK